MVQKSDNGFSWITYSEKTCENVSYWISEENDFVCHGYQL